MLHLRLKYGSDDEVIVPLTMSATTFAVLQANATPVFADVEKIPFKLILSQLSRV